MGKVIRVIKICNKLRESQNEKEGMSQRASSQAERTFLGSAQLSIRQEGLTISRRLGILQRLQQSHSSMMYRTIVTRRKYDISAFRKRWITETYACI